MFVREIVETPPAQPDNGTLATKNAHPRDKLVVLREGDHSYFYIHAPSQTYLRLNKTVTGLISQHFHPFQTKAIAKAVAEREIREGKTSPYYWLIKSADKPYDENEVVQKILHAWEQNASRASSEGTEGHRCLSVVMDGEEFHGHKLPRVHCMVQAGVNWITAKMNSGWVPFRSEWVVYIDGNHAEEEEDGDPFQNHKHLVGGQLDALFQDPTTDEYHLVDWKFCQAESLSIDANSSNSCACKGNGALKIVSDTKIERYRVQLSLYSYILKKRYNITVNTMRVVHIPSDASTPVAKDILLDPLPDEVLASCLASNPST